MIDKDKVLKGLECCCSMTGEACRQCPYDEECAEMIGSGSAHLCSDALELLKKQQEQKFFVDSDGKMTPLPIQKHGYWKQVEEGFTDMMCSECGELALLDLDRDFVLSKYCPNCGARMDGEVKQE